MEVSLFSHMLLFGNFQLMLLTISSYFRIHGLLMFDFTDHSRGFLAGIYSSLSLSYGGPLKIFQIYVIICLLSLSLKELKA